MNIETERTSRQRATVCRCCSSRSGLPNGPRLCRTPRQDAILLESIRFSSAPHPGTPMSLLRSRSPVDRLPILALLSAFALGACGPAARSSAGPSDVRKRSANVITAEDIERYPVSVTVEEILERHSSGLRLSRRHEPGGAISVNVLGMGAPLIVVDGVPLPEYRGALGLNPRDIESIEIRKYGGGTSLYGLRGANGVILIRTKSGGSTNLVLDGFR